MPSCYGHQLVFLQYNGNGNKLECLVVQVVWIVDGKLRKVGTYKELSDDDDFMELVGSQVVAEDLDNSEGEEEAAEGAPVLLPKSGGLMITKQVDKKGLTGATLKPCHACAMCDGG